MLWDAKEKGLNKSYLKKFQSKVSKKKIYGKKLKKFMKLILKGKNAGIVIQSKTGCNIILEVLFNLVLTEMTVF